MTSAAEDRASAPDVTSAAGTALPTSNSGMSLSARLAVVAGALFVEKFVLNFFVDFGSVSASQGLGAAVRAVQHWGFRFAVTLAVALALFTYVHGRQQGERLSADAVSAPLRPKWLLLHAAFLPLLAASTYTLYGEHGFNIPFGWHVALWLALGLGSLLALLAGMALWTLWRAQTGQTRVTWVYAAITAAVSASIIQWGESAWSGMAYITFQAVRGVLTPLIPNLQIDPPTRVIDTGRFAVEIAPQCSGLEGMGLMLAFCSAWLLLFRREYIFPRALILIPAGLLLIFVLNIVRIATLVLIGHAGWGTMAVEGFHSQAGWIAFNGAAGLIAFLSLKSRWLNRNFAGAAEPETTNTTAAYLVPLLAILAAGMLVRALSGAGFQTLYFLGPLAGAIALFHYWPRLVALEWQASWRAPAVGIVAFILWIVAARLLTQKEPMPTALAALTPGWRDLWIFLRIAGSVCIVPVAEELAYRGFLLRRLSAADFQALPFQSARPWALMLSSIVFGLGHGSMWLAGIAAGLLYGGLLIRTGRIGESTVAHATTNSLVACWVVLDGQWQLW